MFTETNVKPSIIAPEIPGLRFRYFQGESDFPVIKDVFDRCKEADGLEYSMTVEEMPFHFSHLINSDPYTDMIFAEVNNEAIGYSRAWWSMEHDGTYIYQMLGWIVPEWRRKGIGTAILEWDENRLRQIAADHPADAPKYFRAGYEDKLKSHIALFKKAGYQPIRYFYDMVRPIDAPLPDALLPEGIDIRPVEEDHYPLIWQAANDAFRDHWGFEEPTDEMYERWLTEPRNDPSLWKIAWDGDKVAGMVLNYVDENFNEEYNRKRGYTENISVGRPWRRRGLASALIVESIRMFREMGHEETALGVDTENTSGALGIYERIGYQVTNKSTNFQKPIE